MCCAPSCVAVKWNFEWDLDLAFELQFLKVLDTLSGRLNLSQRNVSIIGLIIDELTLTTSVLSAATTSRDPPSTRLPGKSGSYSQIAFVFSTTAILVMCAITATFARFTTCSRHLRKDNENIINKK